MNRIFIIVLASFVIFFSSCFEEDERYIPVPIVKVNIPYSIYEYQTYYSISDSIIVSHNYYEDWDLGFESKPGGYHIILNSARYMYAGNTFDADFQNVNTNIAEDMAFDASSGNLDSTILKDWVDLIDAENPVFNQYVYIIDRGKNEAGDEFGIKKIIFEKMENDTFYVHFANLDNTEEYHYMIPKDTTTNFTLFSFDGGGQVIVSEPDKNSWDLCFTKYSTKIPDDYGVLTDYLVRGVFLNPNKDVEVALDTSNYFYDITLEMMNDYVYSSNRDAIGYTWKTFTDGKYIIEENHHYILRNVDGKNYKMRFVRFYNDLGEKGYPFFELTELTNNNIL